MAGYHCEYCNETASSKCASSRNVFPNDQLATMIGNCICFDRDAYYKRTFVPELRISLHAASEPMKEPDPSDHDKLELPDVIYTKEYKLKRLNAAVDMIRSLADKTANYDDNSLRKALCDHRWILDSDHCDLGCHHRKTNQE